MTAIPATLRLRREGALRSRAARGDAVAFAAVYERHHQALYRYCRSILRHEEDAQDALQNTMARAFAALQDERRDFELRPWLFRIAHNEAISILRRRRATDELSDVADARPFEDTIADREELRLLQMDLADLPERQRAALVLRELNGLSHAEIGVVLELSTPAVKQSIFEARSALFSCREGREMGCHDVRRMLSDGDGRVLRGRGVRAHLRSCPDCTRFRTDLEQRPRALKALVPPLPIGTAAALFAELLGAGTAAKLLACVALAGGGATLAVEMRDARQPRPPAVVEAPAKSSAPTAPDPGPQAPPRGAVPAVPAVAATETEPASAPTTKTARRGRTEDRPRERAERERPRRERPERERPRPTRSAPDRPGGPATAGAPAPAAAPERKAEPDEQVKPKQTKPKPVKPQQAKPQKPEKPQKPQKPEKPEKPEKTEKPKPAKEPPPQAQAQGQAEPKAKEKAKPQATPEAAAPPVATPPGAAQRDENQGKSEAAPANGRDKVKDKDKPEPPG